VALEPGARIVQTWRTSEFTQSDPDSRVEIKLVSEDASTRLTIEHGNLPEHGMQYHQGWQDFYFKPMTAHFST
jgi:activator of HSP90 ATPase